MENYHTHTERCKHATGCMEDYIIAAIENGVTTLGMSEHTPFPDNRWLSVRMCMDELQDYCKEFDELKEKYPSIKLVKGLECEYVAEYGSFYKDHLLGECGMEYLILAGHEINETSPWNLKGETRSDKKELKYYTDYLVNAMDTGLFDFVAHPDIFASFYLDWDEEAIACSRYILEAAEALKMPLEINGYGLRKPEIQTPKGMRRKYPLHKFWELASAYDIQVIANSDAHKPQDIIANIEEAYAIADAYSLVYAHLNL